MVMDPYVVLQLPVNADAHAIKKAYIQLAKKLHPDKGDGTHMETEKFRAVQEAYELLSDARRRLEYDRKHVAGAKVAGEESISQNLVVDPFGMNVHSMNVFNSYIY